MENNVTVPNTINTLVIGGGQAGLAMSEHLSNQGVEHYIVERGRIAEKWRTARWDNLVANGPAWHDRFPTLKIAGVDDDAFASKDDMAAYFEDVAKFINAPIACGVEVTDVRPNENSGGYIATTSAGIIAAENIVVATGPFQHPVFPKIIPEQTGLKQIHSYDYKNPDQLDDGGVLVIGAGSSGAQIADELLRSGRVVYLSIGAHDRPPRRYRGHDFVWWLGTLGKWQMKTPPKGKEHVTIAVSGAYDGHTIDFRKFASRGMKLLGMTKDFSDGGLNIAPDLSDNIRGGDENHLSLLAEADAFISANGLDLPPEPEAHDILPDPDCMTNPTLRLDLNAAGVKTVIWATGYVQDFAWLNVDAFDDAGKPIHNDGVSSSAAGIYFLGLPWLSMRGSSFIWGVWEDAKHLAKHIKSR